MRLLCRFLVVLTGVAGASASVSARDIRLGKELGIGSLGEVEQGLKKKFDSDDNLDLHRGASSATMENCETALKLASDGYESAEPDYNYWKSALAKCQALQVLKTAQPASRSYLDGFVLDKRAAAALPPAVVAAVSKDEETSVKTAESKGLTLAQFLPKLRARTDKEGGLVLKTAGFETRVVELARADFDKDGVEDLLVRLEDSATGGSYRAFRLAILGRAAPKARLSIIKEITP